MTQDPENMVKVKLRMFDMRHDAVLDFGKYENAMSQDIKIPLLIKDIKIAFNKLIKQFEIDVTNLKKGMQ